MKDVLDVVHGRSGDLLAGDIPLNHLDVVAIAPLVQVMPIASAEVVQHSHLCTFAEQHVDDVRTDKTGTPGDKASGTVKQIDFTGRHGRISWGSAYSFLEGGSRPEAIGDALNQ
jgi:hypothetical protein